MLHKLEVPFQILERSMDRLESMSTLLTAVEAGSLSAAARQLAIPLSTVSRRISELEAHLKARLLNRSSRKLTLTDAGRSYVEACKRILEDVGEAERAASGEYSAAKGELNITAPMVFGRLHVLPVAMEFLKVYSAVDIRCVLNDRVVNLLEDHIDLALRIGELPDSSSLMTTRIGSVRRVVARPILRDVACPRMLTNSPCTTASPSKGSRFQISGSSRRASPISPPQFIHGSS
jgi:DNA-binding transcriptional LysR family regulator